MCGRAEELVHSRFFVNVVRALAKNRCRAVVARVENHLAQSALVAAGRMAAAWKWREVRASPLSLLSHRNPQPHGENHFAPHSSQSEYLLTGSRCSVMKNQRRERRW